MNKPIVSIASITYNHARYLHDALEGFLMQRNSFPFEIIIYDDASTDGAAAIIEEYAAKYPHLVFPILKDVNQVSRGINPIISYVFPKCHGKYIALCEGDDYWTDPLKLQKQVDFMESNSGYVGCYHRAVTMDDNNEATGFLPAFGDEKDLTYESLVEKNRTPTASVVFRNLLTKRDIQSLDKLYPGDWALYFILAQYGKIKYMDMVRLGLSITPGWEVDRSE